MFSRKVLLAIGLIAATASTARAQTPYQTITSTAGPLTSVFIGNEGSTQIAHVDDATYEFYPYDTVPGDSGTLIWMNGELFAPDFNARGSASGSIGTFTAFTPVSQTGELPVGTSTNTFQIITIYAAGATGLVITQTDIYRDGQESY